MKGGAGRTTPPEVAATGESSATVGVDVVGVGVGRVTKDEVRLRQRLI